MNEKKFYLWKDRFEIRSENPFGGKRKILNKFLFLNSSKFFCIRKVFLWIFKLFYYFIFIFFFDFILILFCFFTLIFIFCPDFFYVVLRTMFSSFNLTLILFFFYFYIFPLKQFFMILFNFFTIIFIFFHFLCFFFF